MGRIYGLWGSDANNVWATADVGYILKWNGTAWARQASATSQTLYNIWGRDANNLWAVGASGAIL